MRLADEVMIYKDEDTSIEYIVNPQRGNIFELNDTARMIIHGIEAGDDIIDISDKIKKECNDAILEEVKKDVKLFIEALVANEIVLSV